MDLAIFFFNHTRGEAPSDTALNNLTGYPTTLDHLAGLMLKAHIPVCFNFCEQFERSWDPDVLRYVQVATDLEAVNVFEDQQSHLRCVIFCALVVS
jgi:hypothetical protein